MSSYEHERARMSGRTAQRVARLPGGSMVFRFFRDYLAFIFTFFVVTKDLTFIQLNS